MNEKQIAIKKTEDVLHKLFCRIQKAPPGATEVEVSLLQEASDLLEYFRDGLAIADRRIEELESELHRTKRAITYRDRVIARMREG